MITVAAQETMVETITSPHCAAARNSQLMLPGHNLFGEPPHQKFQEVFEHMKTASFLTPEETFTLL